MTDTPIKRDGRKENASNTQAALQLAALRWFSEQGYEKASVGAICAEANVTAGALYHHYGDKKGLFAAVAEQVDAQLVQRALGARTAVIENGGTPWDAFLASIDTVLQAGANAPLRRLMLVEAPAVLGNQVWGEIRQRQGLGRHASQHWCAAGKRHFCGTRCAEAGAHCVGGAVWRHGFVAC